MLWTRLLLHLGCCLTGAAAVADPGYYVVTAYDNAGLRSLNLRYWTVKARDRVETVWPELGFAYGVNSRWTTEVFASWIGASNRPTQLSSWNWSNDLLLTQGELPVDVALHTQLVRNRLGERETVLEFGPVLQTDLGRTQLNANLFFERTLASRSAADPTQLKYQWQARYRWMPGVHFGAQGFGELGAWDDWSPRQAQSHRAGPAVFGSLRLNEREEVKLQAAWLMGKTYGRRGHMFSTRLAYDF